jgi:hypothetical protein
MPFIDEYLVRLGFGVDNASYHRFAAILRDAERMVEQRSGSMAGSFLGVQTAIVGGFASIGAAALGMVDKVAMADQDFRLFALHMYMGKDAARSLKIAMDALGQPLENLTWDAELRDRTRRLIEDQRRMAPGGDFDLQMRKVRDIRFEFTRMEVELQYLAMHTVLDFLHALGTGPDELLEKLRKFNDWVISDMPAIAHRIVTEFMPIWKDIKDIAYATGDALRQFAILFTNVVGLLSGDESIEGTSLSLDKMLTAVHHVAQGFATWAESIANVEKLLGHLLNALDLAMSGKFKEAGAELSSAWHDVTAQSIGMIAGGIVGGVFGGPGGALVGSAGGMSIASNLQKIGGPNNVARGFGAMVAGVGGSGGPGGDMVEQVARLAGISPQLLRGVMMAESSGNQNVPDQWAKGVPHMGLMQLSPDIAAKYMVNPRDPMSNLMGGALYLRDLQSQFGSDAGAVGAYNMGPGGMEKVLSGKATLPNETRNEIARVMSSMGKSGPLQIGSVTINIGKTNAQPEDIHSAVKDAIKDAADSKVQRNLSEFQSLSYSY